MGIALAIYRNEMYIDVPIKLIIMILKLPASENLRDNEYLKDIKEIDAIQILIDKSKLVGNLFNEIYINAEEKKFPKHLIEQTIKELKEIIDIESKLGQCKEKNSLNLRDMEKLYYDVFYGETSINSPVKASSSGCLFSIIGYLLIFIVILCLA